MNILSIEEAQAALTAAEAEMSAHMQAEQEMSARMLALDAQETQIEKERREAHEALVNAMATGDTKASPRDMTAAEAKLAAIRDARRLFPARLQEHRSRGDRITGRLTKAQLALKEARFEAAVKAYREAMENVWSLADEVLRTGNLVGRKDMSGIADSRSPKYGRLSG